MDSSSRTSQLGASETRWCCAVIFSFCFDCVTDSHSVSLLFSWVLLASFSHRLTQTALHSLHHTSKVESYCSAIMNHCHTLLPLDCRWLSRTLKKCFFWLELQNQCLKFVFCSKSVFEWWERWRKQPRVLFWGFDPSCDSVRVQYHVTQHSCQRLQHYKIYVHFSNLFLIITVNLVLWSRTCIQNIKRNHNPLQQTRLKYRLGW